MKFALIIYEPESEMSARNDPSRAATYWGAYTAYIKALSEAGVAAGGTGLQPPTLSTTLKIRDGKRNVQDGPYADTKEQLGGFFLIDVSNIDQALHWAAQCPASTSGVVEIRPVLEMQP